MAADQIDDEGNAPAPAPAGNGGTSTLTANRAQNPLTLYLKLRNPADMPTLIAGLESEPVKSKTQAALRGLRNVHFARFVPVPDGSALFVITVYDDDFREYILDFTTAIGKEFDFILGFVQNAPPLPVAEHPEDFVAFVEAHNLPVSVFSAYPDRTVLDIQQALGI